MNTSATILAVDDNPVVLEGLVEYLREVGFRVIHALTGRDGLDMAFRAQPDVIVCDYVIPDLDGLSILRILRQAALTAGIPFIMLSSHADEDVRQQLNWYPETAYVDKCTGICDLADAIRRMLRSVIAPSE